MKLYYMAGASSMAPRISLLEANVSFDAIKVDIKTHKLDDGTDYHTINPMGYVPVLELDDGTRIHELPAVLQYIADAAPDKHLAPPAGTMARIHLQEWLTFTGTELHKSFGVFFKPDMPQEAKAIFTHKLQSRYTWLDAQLKGKTYLVGDHFTVADAYLFVVTTWSKPTGFDLGAYPNVRAFQARILERASVQAAMKAEGLAA